MQANYQKKLAEDTLILGNLVKPKDGSPGSVSGSVVKNTGDTTVTLVASCVEGNSPPNFDASISKLVTPSTILNAHCGTSSGSSFGVEQKFGQYGPKLNYEQRQSPGNTPIKTYGLEQQLGNNGSNISFQRQETRGSSPLDNFSLNSQLNSNINFQGNLTRQNGSTLDWGAGISQRMNDSHLTVSYGAGSRGAQLGFQQQVTPKLSFEGNATIGKQRDFNLGLNYRF